MADKEVHRIDLGDGCWVQFCQQTNKKIRWYLLSADGDRIAQSISARDSVAESADYFYEAQEAMQAVLRACSTAKLKQADEEIERLRAEAKEARTDAETVRGYSDDLVKDAADLRMERDTARELADKCLSDLTETRKNVDMRDETIEGLKADLHNAEEALTRQKAETKAAVDHQKQTRQEATDLQSALDRAEAELEQLRSRGWWARLTNSGA